jgi:hypothetical protein
MVGSTVGFLCLLFASRILCLDKGAALVERELTIGEESTLMSWSL